MEIDNEEDFARSVVSYVKHGYPWWGRLSKEEAAREAVRVIFSDETLAHRAATILKRKMSSTE